MARQVKKRQVMGRAGNYVAPIDTAGMDPEMIAELTGTKANKVESSYISGTRRPSATEAVKRARRANRQPPLRP